MRTAVLSREIPNRDARQASSVSASRILFVCSSGGHLTQLHALEPWWSQLDRHWVTFDKPDARSLLAGERVTWGHHPTTRNVPNAIRNFALARRILARYRPHAVVSNGAGIALPFFAAARLRGIRTVYIEVFDRIDSPTLTGRLCSPLSDLFLLQWPEQRRFYPHGIVIGKLL